MKTIYDNYALLKGEDQSTKLIFLSSTSELTQDAGPRSEVAVTPTGHKNDVLFYPWGTNNDMPDQLIKNAFRNITVGSNLDFNSRIAYGDNVMPVRRVRQEGSNEIKFEPLMRGEAPEVFDFLEENNFSYIQNELSHDLSLLYNGFVELLFNKQRTKVLSIRHLEASYSRLEVMNEDGIIPRHGYCANWNDTANNTVVTTPLLDFGNPLLDLRRRLGQVPDARGKRQPKTTDSRFVMHIAPPSPGRFYYQKAYWWSIFESHWFDFSCAIPEFKMNLMKNQMVLKYHIQIRKGYFEDMYRSEGITDQAKKMERKTLFFRQLEDFLAGNNNAGKNLVSELDYERLKGTEIEDIKITPIESFIKGGEYIEDSEEASNAICYAMGVHPSLQGASPGKGKTINGTEARELFIIKQSMMKSTRELLLSPLYLIKAINKWPKDVEFIIPNIMLTTLDKGTGAQKQIGNQIQ